MLRIEPDDVLYNCLPLFDTNALNAFYQALIAGGCYVLGAAILGVRILPGAG